MPPAEVPVGPYRVVPEPELIQRRLDLPRIEDHPVRIELERPEEAFDAAVFPRAVDM